MYGLEGVGFIGSLWSGSQDFTFSSVSADTFRYRPLDHNTVIAYGSVHFTIEDHKHGAVRTITRVQTEVFRRNSKMPRGWEQVYEQLGYSTPWLGDQQSEISTLTKRQGANTP